MDLNALTMNFLHRLIAIYYLSFDLWRLSKSRQHQFQTSFVFTSSIRNGVGYHILLSSCAVYLNCRKHVQYCNKSIYVNLPLNFEGENLFMLIIRLVYESLLILIVKVYFNNYYFLIKKTYIIYIIEIMVKPLAQLQQKLQFNQQTTVLK